LLSPGIARAGARPLPFALGSNIRVDLETFPPEFAAHIRGLESAYLRETDPIRQSGFSGGPERWRNEREPILSAIGGDGTILDLGCANGFLLECLVAWAGERAITLVPHGVDIGASLVALAKKRLPQFADNFHVANAFAWMPPQRYRYIYTLFDCVPLEHFRSYVHGTLEQCVAPGGRLVVGAYGSRSRNLPPVDVRRLLEGSGLAVAGEVSAGSPVVVKFAWVAA
jgi:SAM-dependent methyltransferase